VGGAEALPVVNDPIGTLGHKPSLSNTATAYVVFGASAGRKKAISPKGTGIGSIVETMMSGPPDAWSVKRVMGPFKRMKLFGPPFGETSVAPSAGDTISCPGGVATPQGVAVGGGVDVDPTPVVNDPSTTLVHPFVSRAVTVYVVFGASCGRKKATSPKAKGRGSIVETVIGAPPGA
jgi:hypothetical protein